MLAISLTLVVLISALLLLYQYTTGALLPADDRPVEPRADANDEHSEPAARAA